MRKLKNVFTVREKQMHSSNNVKDYASKHSPRPNEGHQFEQAKNEPCETACRMAEGLGERGQKAAFTLAEVLITLAIIGVVAALTIPTLVAKINQKVSENRQTTIEARLLDGINRY